MLHGIIDFINPLDIRRNGEYVKDTISLESNILCYGDLGGSKMTVDRMLRLIAGLFVFASVVLGFYVSPYFFLFTAFVGLNLAQSALTNWCPMMSFLRMAGFKG